MSKKSQTKKSTQRQPAAHRLSLHDVWKRAAITLGLKPQPKKTVKNARKKNAKKPTLANRSWHSRIANNSKKSKPRRQRQFSVLLTHSTKIVITIKPVKNTRKKSQASKRLSVWPYLPINRQTAISMMLVVVGVVGALYFGWHSVFASPSTTPAAIVSTKGSVPPAAGNDVKRTRYPKSQPTHLTVPAIGIDTTVTTTGKNSDGSITVPSDFRTAGWYQYSPTPGEIGPSVIVGHLDNVSGVAVFWRLHEMVPGNMIDVTRADGRTLKFKVDSVKQFPQDSFPTKEVYGNIDYAGLRLITCGGTFNRLTGHYDQNTVVYASLES